MSGPVKEAPCPKCGGHDFTGIQYGRGVGDEPPLHPCHYDGVSEWRCNGCGTRIGRWSLRQLAEGDHEPPDGREHRKGCLLRATQPGGFA